MYYVYLLKMSGNKIYTGSTPDIKRRINSHKNGNVISTKKFLPIELIWYCGFNTRLLARKFENYLKSGSGQAFRNRHLFEKY